MSDTELLYWLWTNVLTDSQLAIKPPGESKSLRFNTRLHAIARYQKDKPPPSGATLCPHCANPENFPNNKNSGD